ncbi:MAG TPA: FAD-dependent monooxygenase [Methylibium sp.]|nr:FAD-dependent monooxygenase [Methylibium sp.]
MTELSLAVVGAGPVGLALALHAARALPDARIAVFDTRPAGQDVGRDPRTLALSLGSVQEFERLGVWPAIAPQAAAIRAVHVSQQQPALLAAFARLPQPELRLTAGECGVTQLGAVASYGAIVAPLQAAWLAAVAAEPQRLAARFGTPVAALKPIDGGVEVDAGIAERHDLAVVAEGGVFAGQPRKSFPQGVSADYGQTAWVGQVTIEGADPADAGTAYERFTPQGPAALLPLPAEDGAPARAALVWCVNAADDPVRALDDAQRLAVLNTVFHPRVGRLVGITPLKDFALGLNAERTLVEGRTVRIGNAAQTLHPVAGQGLNLGLRDAHALVAALQGAPGGMDAALRKVEWQRAPDRWALIATTDFLARSFTWPLPGLASARGLGLAALQALGPLRRAVARQMMFGWR